MTNGINRIVDPTAGAPVFVVCVLRHIDGWDYETRTRAITGVRCEVLSEDGFISYMRLPYEAGALHGVPVEDLAKRLGTTPDNILF